MTLSDMLMEVSKELTEEEKSKLIGIMIGKIGEIHRIMVKLENTKGFELVGMLLRNAIEK